VTVWKSKPLKANLDYPTIINTAAKAITAIAVEMMISAMMSLIGSLPGTVVPPPPVG
jgi:hypothetical protein